MTFFKGSKLEVVIKPFQTLLLVLFSKIFILKIRILLENCILILGLTEICPWQYRCVPKYQHLADTRGMLINMTTSARVMEVLIAASLTVFADQSLSSEWSCKGSAGTCNLIISYRIFCQTFIKICSSAQFLVIT